MSFQISGLDRARFEPLFALSDAELAERGVLRRTADAKPGYPCRVSLEDAEPGDTLLLLNYESHAVATPYRSAYAIYVNESSRDRRLAPGEIPGVLKGRPLALRVFDKDAMLIGAELAAPGELAPAIDRAFTRPGAAYVHAHNAAHGCYAARIDRA